MNVSFRVLRGVVVVALVVGASLAATQWVRQRRRVPVPARFAVVRHTDLDSQILLTGKVDPKQKVVVKSRMPGRVAKVFVNEGDRVQAGQAIALIESTELERQAAQFRNALGAAMTQLPATANEQSRRRGNLVSGIEQAERHLRMAQQLLDAPVGGNGDGSGRDDPRAHLDRLGAELLSLKLSAAQQEQQLQTLGGRGQLQRLIDGAAALRFAQQQLTIRTPIAGTVIKCATLPGDLVTGGGNPLGGGQELAVIADSRRMVVRALVPEVDVARLREGQDAIVRLDALRGESLPGRLARIGAAALETRGLLGQFNPNEPVWFQVEVQLEKPDPRLRAGMTANVDVAMSKLRRVLTLSREAVFEEKNQWYVWRVKDRALSERARAARGGPVNDAQGRMIAASAVKPEKTLVHLGAQDDLNVQIRAGLEDGDVVLIRPPLHGRRTFEIK